MDGSSPEYLHKKSGITFFNESDSPPEPIEVAEIDFIFSERNAGGLGKVVIELSRFNQNNQIDYTGAINDSAPAITVDGEGNIEETTIGELARRGYYSVQFQLPQAHLDTEIKFDVWIKNTPLETTGNFSSSSNMGSDTLGP